ncbi:MAG: DUF2914 domain-containing protein [Desulfobacterales bacterium]|jgi:hypothetical protein
MQIRCLHTFFVCAAVCLSLVQPLLPVKYAASAHASQLELFQALMCEEIYSNAPRNPTAAFSVKQKKAICFTSFSQVPQKMIIYHNWYHRDVPSAKIRLTLKPPRWSTYSSIELNTADIGPWRVEITTEAGTVLEVLRFSVTE